MATEAKTDLTPQVAIRAAVLAATMAPFVAWGYGMQEAAKMAERVIEAATSLEKDR